VANKTVVSSNSDDDNIIVNPIVQKQKEDVAKMRTSLLSCNEESGMTVSRALQDITIMRVYHQLTRIIRFTEMMDKIEDKLYEAIDYQLETCDIEENSTLITLLGLQEKLQKSMIESQKLLDPYLNMQLFNIVDLSPTATDTTDNPITKQLLTSESRDKIRYTAQSVIEMLAAGDG
jgi:hypothetical protein